MGVNWIVEVVPKARVPKDPTRAELAGGRRPCDWGGKGVSCSP